MVFARIRKADTLAGMIKTVEEMASRTRPRRPGWGLWLGDVMLVPKMNWQVAHWFYERGGLVQAVQDTSLRLDRSGVELRVGSKSEAAGRRVRIRILWAMHRFCFT